MDGDNETKNTVKNGKHEEKTADKDNKKYNDKTREAIDIPVVPGFLLLKEWFCKMQTQSALGILVVSANSWRAVSNEGSK
mgnify:CR=1 FL=1